MALFVGRLSFHAKAHPFPMYVALEEAARQTRIQVHLIQAGWFASDFIEGAFKEGAARWCPSVGASFLDGRDADARADAWAAADLFVSLSDNIQESFGLTPVEAMAAGLPCVVSDWDGYKDTVRDGVDGFRVPTVAPPRGLGTDLALRFAAGIDDYDRYIGRA
ncbi:MAG: glycosyltransferase, partial [Rhodospirillales bacterium]